MFRSFLILAYRNFKRSRLTSFIELIGMTLGLTIFLLILLWVFNETGYDKFNENADRIYRLEWSATNKEKTALVPYMVPFLLKENLPEVENTARFRYRDPSHQIYTINEQGTKNYFASGIRMNADNSMFDMFSFDFLEGNPANALSEINTVIITESLAKTLFNNDSPIGKSVFFVPDIDLTVTAVIKDVPNFHIPFKMLYNYKEMDKAWESLNTKKDWRWGFFSQATYLLVNPEHDVALLEKKITNLIALRSPQDFKDAFPNQNYYLGPLTDVYFNGGDAVDMGHSLHGDRKKLIAYSSIAIIALLMACINFINLNSAKSLERAREVGIKKVMGATRLSIFIQFLGEVIILCNMALILALIFTHLFLPNFNNLLGTSLSLGQLLKPYAFIAMVVGLLLISLLSGGVPALYMASFKPASVIKGLPVKSVKGINFRKTNLVIQFALISILLIGSITVFRQIGYMKNTNLGFDKDHRVLFPFTGFSFNREVLNVFKRTLLTNPNVLNVTHSNAVPGRNVLDVSKSFITVNGIDYEVTNVPVDPDYMNTLNLTLLKGRFFVNNRLEDFYAILDTTSTKRTVVNVLLNETAVKQMGLEQAVGATGKYKDGLSFRVIGILKDFHVNSLNAPIDPMMMQWSPNKSQMIVHISGTDIASTLQFIEDKYEDIALKKPELSFLDQTFNKQYHKDENFAELIFYFTILVILIACMGLFGVGTLTIKLRLKEIGIRKTLGASPWVILKLITFYFLKILLLSILIAVPIAWLAMDSWLSNYAYRIELTSWVFIVGCGLTVAIALATIIWQSWQASNINPVELIRYE